MKRILCYGDSNTWGYISGSDHLRYDNNSRWTKLLQNKLGSDYEVIEEGLNSRTLFSEDTRKGKEGKNGFVYLKPCLETHDKLDLVLLMLGTNELKYEFKNSANDVFLMLKKYVEFINNYKSQIDKSTPKLIILGVALVNDECDYCKNKYEEAGHKSRELNELLKEYCNNNNITYMDNTDLQVGIDGVHLTKESHNVLANKLEAVIKNI